MKHLCAHGGQHGTGSKPTGAPGAEQKDSLSLLTWAAHQGRGLGGWRFLFLFFKIKLLIVRSVQTRSTLRNNRYPTCPPPAPQEEHLATLVQSHPGLDQHRHGPALRQPQVTPAVWADVRPSVCRLGPCVRWEAGDFSTRTPAEHPPPALTPSPVASHWFHISELCKGIIHYVTF